MDYVYSYELCSPELRVHWVICQEILYVTRFLSINNIIMLNNRSSTYSVSIEYDLSFTCKTVFFVFGHVSNLMIICIYSVCCMSINSN